LLGEVTQHPRETEEECKTRLLKHPDFDTAVVPANHPSALRLLLMGSSLNYPTGSLALELSNNPCWQKKFSHGIPGAFALQPHFMLDDVQWLSYARSTRKMRLYVPFGTWRTALGKVDHSQAPPVGPYEDVSPKTQALLNATTISVRLWNVVARTLWNASGLICTSCTMISKDNGTAVVVQRCVALWRGY